MPVLLGNRDLMSMRGKPRNPPASPVGEWIDENMDRLGWTVRRLAEVAGVSQPRITQLRQGDSTTRDMIERLAHAFSREDTEPQTALHLLNTGLKAAGFASVESEDADHEVIDYLRGKPEPMQDKALRMLRAAFDEEDAIDNAGNIGKKPK